MSDDDASDIDGRRFDLAIIGGGSAAEQLLREIGDSGLSVVLFEEQYVGGECPFLACIPSKSMLHDVRTERVWSEAVDRRDELTSHRDDSSHADDARDLGATIVRARARLEGPGTVSADGDTYSADRIVVAVGAMPIVPDIDGLDADHDRVWTSRDVMTSVQQPASVVMIGGGVIGSELAFMYAGYGTRATTLDESERPADDLHPTTSELIRDVLTDVGVNVLTGIEIERVELTDDDATVYLTDGSSHTAERLIVSIGRKPAMGDLGLDSIGVDPSDVEVGDAGQVVGADGVWIAGDAAGLQQYTHIANHHATVIADHLVGDGKRAYDDVVVPACIFLDPPVMVVGPTWADLQDDDDVVWAEIDLDTPRTATDEHRPGFLAVAARRSTGCIVAANGIGARFDEIVHALVIAIDGEVPVSRLTQTIQPFPTVGEVLTQVFDDLADQLTDRPSPHGPGS